MLLNKVRQSVAAEGTETPQHDRGKPLSCIIFFFASQMSCNLETPVRDSTRNPGERVHRLDALLSEVGSYANRSPYVTRFEAIPVEMAPPGRPRGTTRQEMHDTLLLASFTSKKAWRKWIETPEWQKFMQQTEKEAVFRRMPHIRCAHSLKGLRNPLEVLMA